MKVFPIKTHKITKNDKDLFAVLNKYLPKLEEGSILAITSKIVSITEGRLVKMEEADPASAKGFGEAKKDELIKQESQFYLPRDENPYNVSFTITRNMLAATAGIDESNGNGYYIWWPKNPQESANKIREYLKKRFKLKNVGVIITDSKTSPLRWGVTSVALSYSGFKPLKDYIGKRDLFERKFDGQLLSIQNKKIKSISAIKVAPELTEKQKQAIELAIKRGYYTSPRKISLQELAKISKLSFSTFQVHLRKAEEKLIPFYFE